MTRPQSMRGFVGEVWKSAFQALWKAGAMVETSAGVGRILEQMSIAFQPRRGSFEAAALAKSRRPLRRASFVCEGWRVVL